MRIISDSSLVCFLHDLRRLLAFFNGQVPRGIYFLNMDAMGFYFELCFPKEYLELAGILEIISPFLPVIITKENLEALLTAHEAGCPQALAELEEKCIRHSKFKFVNTIMTAKNSDFEDMVAVCRRVRELKAGLSSGAL